MKVKIRKLLDDIYTNCYYINVRFFIKLRARERGEREVEWAVKRIMVLKLQTNYFAFYSMG